MLTQNGKPVEAGRTERAPGVRLAISLAALVALLASGCGGKGEVSGQVTFKGEPIPWGRITFLSQEGNRPAISSSIRNGNYTIKGCPTGLVKISVESFKAVARDPRAGPQGMAKGFQAPQGTEEPPAEAIGKYLAIPQKYGNAETSGLEYTVTRGQQEHSIPLGP
jgi:hypothetical protein